MRRDHQKASPPAARRRPLADLIARVCAATGSHPTALQQGSRRAAVARAREGIAYLAIEIEGYTGRTVADVLGVNAPSIYRAAQRGRLAQEHWHRLIAQQEE